MIKEDTDKKKYHRFNSDSKIWILFYSLVALTFLLARIFPIATTLSEATEQECITKLYDELGYPCLPFDFEQNPIYSVVATSNNSIPFAVLTARPRRRMSMAASSVNLRAEVSLYILNAQNEVIERVYLKRQVSHGLNCNDLTVHCDSMELASVQDLAHERYIFIINFFNIDRVRAAHISEVDLFFINTSTSYSLNLTLLHYILLLYGIFNVFKLSGFRKFEKLIGDDLGDLIALGYSLILLNDPFSFFTLMEGSMIFTIIENFGIALASTCLLNYFEALANKFGRVNSNRGFKTLCIVFFIFMLVSTRNTFEHHIEAQRFLGKKWLKQLLGFANIVGTLVKLTALVIVLNKYLRIIKEQNILPKERTSLVISSFFLIMFMIMIFTDCMMIDFFSTTKNIYLLCFTNFYFFLMARIKFNEEESIQSLAFKKIDNQNLEDGKNV